MRAKKQEMHPDELLGLVEQIAQGSDLAFERFWRLVEPRVEGAVRNPRLMHKLADRPAERADCKQTIALKLRKVLPMYLEYQERKRSLGRSPSLMRWAGVIICNAAIDFRRKHPEYQRTTDDERDRRWRTFINLGLRDDITSSDGVGLTSHDQTLTFSRAHQFREMIQWASTNLPSHQLDALLRWLYAEDTRQSKATRAALRKLRDRFRGRAS